MGKGHSSWGGLAASLSQSLQFTSFMLFKNGGKGKGITGSWSAHHTYMSVLQVCCKWGKIICQ